MFYRKYRPQTIGELDNKRIRETLGKTLLSNSWVHAYLFIGPRGTGKTSAARILAKVVNCPNRKKGQEPCNKCDSCREIAAGNCLDVIEIDAASNTGVDDIRDLREKVRLAPTKSRYKVYIIDEVHMLSTSAFNALLKTLEEPPEHVIFVLATTEPQKLPETIVSRCLVYDFGKVTQDEIVGSLSRVAQGEKLKVEEEVLVAVASKASGSFRDAHKLLEQLLLESAKLALEHLDALKPTKIDEVSQTLLGLITNRKSKEALVLIEDFAKDGQEKFKELIASLITKLGDILLLRNGVSVDVEDLTISNEEIQRLIMKLVEASSLMRDCPVPQLPLEMVVIEFGGDEEKEEKKEMVKPVLPVASDSPFSNMWPQVLAAVKPLNHSLVALLRASRPKSEKDGFLTVEVFYKFHKDKLEDPKNREILEGVVSDIMKKDLKIKFVLGGEKHGNV